MEKHTLKYIEKFFEDNNCTLLEKEYVGCSTKMKYICSCGNVSKIAFKSFRIEKRCKKCKDEERRKLIYTDLKKFFEDNGCELLEEEYKGAHLKVKYKCICGNISKIRVDSFKYGNRCTECGILKRADIKRHSYKYVKEYFEEHGCKLLEKEYKNDKTKMKYICSCERIGKIRFADFKEGRRCKGCGDERSAETQKFSFEYANKYFEDRGCELLEDSYINNSIKMKYKCSCGNISKIRFSDFKNGDHRCRKCGWERITGKNHYKWIQDRKLYKENLRFKQRCCGILNRSLKRTKQTKDKRTYLMLGYTSKELQEYIKKHKNWEKVKDKKYHVDHIYPLQAFLNYGIKDIKLINSLDNLQPLLGVDNIKKGTKYNKEEFENWLKGKGYEF